MPNQEYKPASGQPLSDDGSARPLPNQQFGIQEFRVQGLGVRELGIPEFRVQEFRVQALAGALGRERTDRTANSFWDRDRRQIAGNAVRRLWDRNRRKLAARATLLALAITTLGLNLGPSRVRASGPGAGPIGTTSSLAESSSPQRGMLPVSSFPCVETIRPQAGPPQTPTGLIGAFRNGPLSAGINLSWAPAPGADNALFGLERKLSTDASFTRIALICGSITSYSDTAFQGSSNDYRIQAFNSAGSPSGYSNVVTVLVVLPVVPGVPSTPSLQPPTVVSSIQINLVWTEASTPSFDGFFIERKTGAGGTFAQIAQLTASATSYSDTGLSPSTTYFYQMRAFKNNVGVSNYSNTVNATTLSTPAPPSNLTATAPTAAQINLSWTYTATNQDGFSIERATGSGAYSQIATVAANLTSYQDSDPALLPAAAYNYRVRAFSNAAGYSPYSNIAPVTTPNPVPAPTSLAATAASSAEIDLIWTNSTTSVDSVRVERKVGSGGTYVEIATLAPTTTSFADTEVTQGTTFYYRVRAYSSTQGNSTYSNEANATTPVPPLAPTNLTATAIPSMKINLAWTRNSTNETGFKIERKATSTGTYVQITTVAAGTTSYQDQDAALQAGTTYYYRVRAYNTTLGNSAYTNEAGATALPNPAPTISGISPNTGVNSGGTAVTITGTGFLSGATVTIGGVAATGVTVASSTSITATTAAHANGAVDVVVTNTDSQSATLAGSFTYTNPPPTVSSISPSSGLTTGGTAVTITGTAFAAGATVKLGGTPATGITVASGTSITATTPAHSAGAVDVAVTNSDGGTGSLHNGFTYNNPAPTVTSISPSTGLTTGGTSVTITGTGFLTGATLKLGGTAATGVSVASATSITATSPSHAVGAADVVVTNSDGQSGTLAAGFTYTNPPPNPTAISPSSGTTAGGTGVTITGTGFLTGATVTLGGTVATGITVSNSTSISAATPAHAAGAVNVVVTNTDNQSGTLANAYSYSSAPVVTSISPVSGAAAGGTAVTITGTGFQTGATVALGGTAATGVTVVSSTSITATTAAHSAGAVNVVVTNPDTQSGTLSNGFTYLGPPPTVSSVSPVFGPGAGGASVTITGTGFQTGATVTFGGAAATGVTVSSSTSMTATTPAHSSGSVNLIVTNPDTQSATLANGFRYTLLQDGFTTLDSSKWTVGLFTITPTSTINVAASGGQLQIGPTVGGISGNNYNGVKSVNTYDFTGAYVYVSVVQAGITQVEAVLSVGPNSNNWYSIAVRDVASNTNRIQCRRSAGGTQTTVFTATTNTTVPQFIRIRHDPVSGNVVFETAPSSGGLPRAWTQVYSEAWNSSVTLTSSLFEIKAGSFNAGSSVTPAFATFQASKP